MINTLIFDLDGTLLNTLEDLKNATNFALNKFGYPERSIEEIRNFVGNGVRKLIERALLNGAENPDFEACLDTFKKNYKEIMYNHTAPYDGIFEMLKIAREKGCKIAVVSNKFDVAVKELCGRYFGSLIDIAIGESENVRKKPAPDSVFEAMKLLNSKPENSVYIGDSDVDIETAKNAKLPCISVTWGFRDKNFLIEHGGRIFIDRPMEIFTKLQEIQH